jgi:hypothetical protein
MILSAGTATYAYTSDDVLPGNPLYPVREQIEKIEEAIASTPDARTQVVINHAARRAKEVQKLADTHKQVTITQIDKMNQALDRAEAAAANTENVKRSSFDRELKRIEGDHERIVGDLPDRIFLHDEDPALYPPDDDVNDPAAISDEEPDDTAAIIHSIDAEDASIPVERDHTDVGGRAMPETYGGRNGQR